MAHEVAHRDDVVDGACLVNWPRGPLSMAPAANPPQLSTWVLGAAAGGAGRSRRQHQGLSAGRHTDRGVVASS